MAKVYVTDEVNDSYTQDVLPSGAAEVASSYFYYGIPSGTASGTIITGAILLHTIIVAETGSGIFKIGHVAADLCASAITIANSASALPNIGLFTRASYLFDVALDAGFVAYRLSALNSDGIGITYQKL